MIDVKKLVVGFLILAVAGSVSALIVGGSGNTVIANGSAIGSAAIPADGGATAIVAQPSAAPIAGNAFLPQPADQTLNDAGTASSTDASSTDAIINDPGNLTGVLASAYLNNIRAANPNGPQDDGTGNKAFAQPDPNSVIMDFANASKPTNIQIPDWDAEAAEVPMRTISSSPAVMANYGAALGNILDSSIVKTNLQNMLGSMSGANPDLSVASYAAQKITSALRDISGLQTPAPAASFQRSLIKTLVYAKNALALGADASKDPIKTAVIMQAEQTKYDTAVQDLQNEIQRAQSANLFSFGQNKTRAGGSEGNGTLTSLQMLFGIPVARAQVVVSDPVAEGGVWATVARMIYAELKDVTLQIAKNLIIFAMQHTIFKWISTPGAPGFIQNWARNAANAFQITALAALDNQMLCINAAPFAPQIRLVLGTTYNAGSNNVCAVQFDSQLGNNLSNFYNDFSQGGWLTYGETLQPDNNYYGSLFFTAQAVDATGLNGLNAANTKAIANQGFHGSARCDDGSNPNGVALQCDGPGGTISTQASACPADHPTLIESVPNSGYCMNGQEPVIKTPGKIAEDMVNSALDSNFKLVTSANSWAGLASGLFVSIIQQALNSLADYSISTVSNAVNSAAQNGGGNIVAGNYVPPQGGNPLTCDTLPPFGGPVGSTFILTAGGGKTLISGNGQTPTFSTPAYKWTLPAGATLVHGSILSDTIQVTFNATGTYTFGLQDTVDNLSMTCPAIVN